MARNAGLDCMRGAAVLFVLGNHIGIRMPLSHTALVDIFPKWFLSGLNYNGTEAVYVFFVLSGFLITSRLCEKYGSLDALKPWQFIAGRARRIFPCLLFLLFILLVLNAFHVDDYMFVKSGQTAIGATAAALGLYFNVWQAQHGWSVASWTVLWSLSIEELFYLGFPLICRMGRWVRWVCCGVLVVVGQIMITHSYNDEIWQDENTLTGMGCISLGVVCALIAPHLREKRFVFIMPLLAAMFMLPDMFFMHFWWDVLGRLWLNLFVVGAACLVLFCALKAETPLPGLYWLRRIGQLSYEIYFICLSC
ncbi:acyltransferase family protein [Neokomagataea anthophila]|uniref:Acyltransferase n=1 Tax=Neokomagataea anthophila TaxID=2826925 RepID=A0ABS5E6Y2_9PROT|nr:acyltransferase [Neokomagataea anthophila]MBR0559675.1 acyltransferase [Neokomagataea anthophila]